MIKIKILTLFLFISYNLFAQKKPITIHNLQAEYCFYDTLKADVGNNDSSLYFIKICLEKLSETGIWEEVTNNILMSKDEIEGKAKGDISYYLRPLDKIKIELPFYKINLPNLFVCSDDVIPSKTYRFSMSDETKPELVLTGKFRFSIVCKGKMYQTDHMVIKSDSFEISSCN